MRKLFKGKYCSMIIFRSDYQKLNVRNNNKKKEIHAITMTNYNSNI